MIDVVYLLIGVFILLWIITFLLLSKDIFKTGLVKVHKVKIKERESFWIMIVVNTLCIGIIVGEFIKLRPATTIYSYIGALLILIGGLIRIYSRKELDRFFSFEVVVQKDHKLIKTGLYKSIRHPMYLGMVFMFFGLAIAFSSFYGVLALIVFYIPALLYRISAEEGMLIKEFGKQYLDYMEKTKKIIPKLY
ncbi:isoprenylcysteine carboxylmethyltransferase family protein [Candidatus Woesearchaeota archaeon]|nr:isoprenylcysteine carboxylmethyltransferase family protein [Candidatus Woesearchaeota archaeon]MBW3005244.1 isoprenylcysteine carboxylmethyltransferase family protein [Candidatus Woesearchaeota archaeon]